MDGGSIPPSSTDRLMSRDIGKDPNPHWGSGFLVLRSCGSAWWSRGAVVAAFGVEGEGSEDFCGGGVDDACVVAVDEQHDGDSVEGSSEADVVHVTRSDTLPELMRS